MPAPIAELLEAAAASFTHSANPDLDAETLFRGVSGLSRSELLLREDTIPPPEIADAFADAARRRASGEPIQYVLGRASFWRDEFMVTKAVLIPRPETELLVEAVATRLRSASSPQILDLGTGSGCIALSLLRELPAARALACDVSPDALAVARTNAGTLGRADRIDFVESSWFDEVDPGLRFDAIVSNPPYVAAADRPGLPREVRDFEPELALFAREEDDLSSYRAIAGSAAGHLVAGGLLGFEVGLGQADRVAALLSAGGFGAIEVLDDLSRIPRVVLGRRS